MLEDTFAIIKPDAFGKPWVEYLLEKNDAEDEPPADGDGSDAEERPPREEWKRVANVRAPDMGVEIISRIERAGFEIVKRKTLLLTPKVRGGAGALRPPGGLQPGCCACSHGPPVRAAPRTLLSSTRNTRARASILVW